MAGRTGHGENFQAAKWTARETERLPAGGDVVPRVLDLLREHRLGRKRILDNARYNGFSVTPIPWMVSNVPKSRSLGRACKLAVTFTPSHCTCERSNTPF